MPDAPPSHRSHPAVTRRSDGACWPVPLWPIALRPIALRPIALRPIALRPIALRPIALRPIALRPIALGLVWLGAVACGAPAPAQSPSGPAGEEAARGPSAEAVAAAKTGIVALGNAAGGEGGGDLAHASATALRLIHIDASAKPDFDGVPREWARSTLLSDVLSGSPKARGAVTVEYDEEAVYVGGEIEDASFTRTDRFGDQEDRVVLTLAFPVGGGTFVPYEVGFFPGIPGETQGTVRFGAGARKGKEIPRGRIVEAPRAAGGIQAGYTFEASVPWSTFAEARTTRVGLRGSVRYVDADVPGRLHGVLGTGRGDAAHVSELPPSRRNRSKS